MHKDQQTQQTQTKLLMISTKGELCVDLQVNNLKVLPHENLHSIPAQNATKALSLSTLSYHRENLLSLENTSITPTLIDHELHIIKNNQQTQQQQNVLIVDSSCYGVAEKTADCFKKYHIIRGYQYQIPSALISSQALSISKETQFLISAEHISKQIDYVFSGLAVDQRRGFIGEIDLNLQYGRCIKSIFYDKGFRELIGCYERFSVRTGCPIYVNLLKYGSNGYTKDGLGDQVSGGNQMYSLEELRNFLFKIFPNVEVYKNIVLINPMFRLRKQIENKSICYMNMSSEIIENFYKFNFNVCYDLSRYWDENCLTWVWGYGCQYIDQTILSVGLKYKTDFIQFGGEGYQIERYLGGFGDVREVVRRTMKENVLRLFTWFQKKIVIVQMKMWKCVQCGKESPETEESFRKFGKDFCSIDCLRSHKF